MAPDTLEQGVEPTELYSSDTSHSNSRKLLIEELHDDERQLEIVTAIPAVTDTSLRKPFVQSDNTRIRHAGE